MFRRVHQDIRRLAYLAGHIKVYQYIQQMKSISDYMQHADATFPLAYTRTLGMLLNEPFDHIIIGVSIKLDGLKAIKLSGQQTCTFIMRKKDKQ